MSLEFFSLLEDSWGEGIFWLELLFFTKLNLLLSGKRFFLKLVLGNTGFCSVWALKRKQLDTRFSTTGHKWEWG